MSPTRSRAAAPPSLRDKDIRRRVGERSFKLGQRYYQDGAVFSTRRQGRTLKADCRGSSAPSYRVRVTFDDDGIAEAECSCPVGDGGYCKHTAAVLLTWRHEPEAFTEIEEVETSLDRRSKAELIALVKQMIRRQPDLELLLEMPLPAAGQSARPASPEVYRRQAAAVFRGADPEWGYGAGVADELRAIKEVGDTFLEQEDYRNAAAVYLAIAGEILQNEDAVNSDEEGALGSVVAECVTGLGKCLAGEPADPVRREALLRALFEVYRDDVTMGGVGLGDEVPDLILEHATPEERRTVAGWAREAIPQGSQWGDDWQRKALGGFLMKLEADSLDDAAFLRICRETGRRADLVDRLLQLGRLDEAEAEARRTDDDELLTLADLFVRHRQAEVGERLVLERSEKTRDMRLLEWLKRRAANRKNSEQVLHWALQIFRQHPTRELYREIQKLVGKDRWPARRQELLALLKKQHPYLLVQIYLKEGEIDPALEMVRAKGGHAYGMRLEVARAAEQDRPEAARDIYREHAEALIDHRGRENYRDACRLLKKARSLSERLGEVAAWEVYLAELRERHRSLRAFQEEMAKAGL